VFLKMDAEELPRWYKYLFKDDAEEKEFWEVICFLCVFHGKMMLFWRVSCFFYGK